MVALQDGAFTTVPLSTVANRTRLVPLDSPLIPSALDVGTSFGIPSSEIERPEPEHSSELR
jgi:6-phosphofructokinase 1